jgi:hypothetical protein
LDRDAVREGDHPLLPEVSLQVAEEPRELAVDLDLAFDRRQALNGQWPAVGADDHHVLELAEIRVQQRGLLEVGANLQTSNGRDGPWMRSTSSRSAS